MADPTADVATSLEASAISATGATESWNYLIPKMREYNISNAAYYERLFVYDPEGEKADVANATDLNAAIDPLADMVNVPDPAQPLLGALLSFEQGWKQIGTALGRLAHSICLAPGEVTRVAMIEWQRKSTASSTKSAEQSESVQAGTDQGTAMSAVQNAVAHETQFGSSSVMNMAVQSEAGVSAAFLGTGASASVSSSFGLGLTASMSQGDRNLAANAVKSINQKTLETSQAVRSRRSTEIQEVSQSEAESATTRVLANYNHMHALTMMYFEVLQIFQLSTDVIRSQRCIFLPMKLLNLGDDAVITKHHELLLGILAELGLDSLRKALEVFSEQATILDAEITVAQKAQDPFQKAYDAAVAAFNKRVAALPFDNDSYDSPRFNVRNLPDPALDAATAALQASQRQVATLVEAKKMKARGVGAVLMKYQLLINQHIWMRLDPSRIQRIVWNKKFRGEPLGTMVDPRPIGVFGSYLALRWRFSNHTEEQNFRSKFEAIYARQKRQSAKPGAAMAGDDPAIDLPETIPEATVALPSGGFFGEAVLGESNAAEKIDLTRFWNWKNSPIPILPPEMAPISVASRARDVSFSGVDFAASLAQLKDLDVPPGSELDKALDAVSKQGMFENMSNQEVLGKIVEAAQKNAQLGAQGAGQNAVQSAKNLEDFYVKLADSEAGKAITKAAIGAVAPEGEAATVLGGLANLKGAIGAAANAAPKSKPAAEEADKVVAKPAAGKP